MTDNQMGDPRVSPRGNGYTVATSGGDVHALDGGAMGWGLYHGDNLDMLPAGDGFATGYGSADDAVGAALQADNRASGSG